MSIGGVYLGPISGLPLYRKPARGTYFSPPSVFRTRRARVVEMTAYQYQDQRICH
jgi:hypothetical protein